MEEIFTDEAYPIKFVGFTGLYFHKHQKKNFFFLQEFIFADTVKSL